MGQSPKLDLGDVGLFPPVLLGLSGGLATTLGATWSWIQGSALPLIGREIPPTTVLSLQPGLDKPFPAPVWYTPSSRNRFHILKGLGKNFQNLKRRLVSGRMCPYVESRVQRPQGSAGAQPRLSADGRGVGSGLRPLPGYSSGVEWVTVTRHLKPNTLTVWPWTAKVRRPLPSAPGPCP